VLHLLRHDGDVDERPILAPVAEGTALSLS
jgi:hypothetical protein